MPEIATIPSVTARVLAAHTAHVFGIMGEGNAHFLHHAEAAGLPVTPVRHESGAVAAADAFFRTSGKLAVATTTYGAGFTNALTALAASVKARIPLVFVTGGRGAVPKPWDIDEFAHLQSLGVPAFGLGAHGLGDHEHGKHGADNYAPVAATVKRAVEMALTESRPVALVIAEHLVTEPAPEPNADDLAAVTPSSPDIATEPLERIVETLLGARRPLILGGRGVWAARAVPQFERLADLLGADLTTTAAARNLWGNHPRNLGGIGGFAEEHIAERVRGADVVLAVGTTLTPFTMRFGASFADDAVVIQSILDETQFHPRADITLLADAAELGDELASRVDSALAGMDAATADRTWRPFDGPSHWSKIAQFTPTFDTKDRSPGERVDPDIAARALNEALPRERTVVSDGGHFLGWPTVFWEVPDPAAFVQAGTAYKCIGLGTGAAAGAAYARPDRTTVLVSGDGGLQMALADLVTFADAPGRKIAVVFNDAGYGAEGHQFEPRSLSLTMAEIGDRDFAAIGRALGGEGMTVRAEEDVAELAEWVHAHPAEGFVVVDLKIRRGIARFFEEIVQHGIAAEDGR